MTAPARSMGRRETLGDFRGAAGHLAGSVAVVIAETPNGPHAATASSVVVASHEPPMLAVFLRREGRTADAIAASGRFTASILRAEDHTIALRLANPARPAGQAGLAGIDLVSAYDGPPALARAVAWFACRVRETAPAGDHLLFLGEVEASARDRSAGPLVHHRGRLHRLGGPVAPAPWLEAGREDLAADW